MAEATEAQIRAEKLFLALMKDSKANPIVRQKAKEIFEDVEFPEDQVDPLIEPLRSETKALKEELEALRKEREEEREARALESQKQNLEQALNDARARYNLTDEGFDKMVARMKETGNYSDADAAAAWVAQSAPKLFAPHMVRKIWTCLAAAGNRPTTVLVSCTPTPKGSSILR
jgi:DNA repair exonuclease SbcCD ATPase subunit